jgi:uncharacterized membrane protein YhaH (DUF805 family)
MSFLRAIVSAFSHAFDFRGRANRREFWFFVLFAVAVWLGMLLLDLYYLAPLQGFMPMEDGAPSWASDAWSLLCVIPTLSLIVRRVHDHDRSAWLALTVLPLAWWLIAKGTKGPNRFG